MISSSWLLGLLLFGPELHQVHDKILSSSAVLTLDDVCSQLLHVFSIPVMGTKSLDTSTLASNVHRGDLVRNRTAWGWNTRP